MTRRLNRRKYVRRWYRQTPKRIDRTGMINGRLLFLEWLGVWRGKHHWWRALCDCGTTCEVVWRRDIKSCGCQNAEQNRLRNFDTQRDDGTWGQHNLKRLKLADGTTIDLPDLVARIMSHTGITKRVATYRIERWPEDRWLDPKRYVGAAAKQRDELIREKRAGLTGKRKQPWARDNYLKINAEGRNRPKEKRREESERAGQISNEDG